MLHPRTFDGQIRKATADDVGSMLELHYRLFDLKTNHLLLLGRRFLGHAFRWYCVGPRAFALVAEYPSAVVGYITVSHGSYYSVFSANWIQVTVAILSKPTLVFHEEVWRRLLALLRGRRKGRKGALSRQACLAYLGVEPAARSKGVAPALVLAALRECQARGWQTAVTSFHAKNILARFLYSSLGFQTDPEPQAGDLVTVRFDTSTLPSLAGSRGERQGS